jgi:hypothetical protein
MGEYTSLRDVAPYTSEGGHPEYNQEQFEGDLAVDMVKDGCMGGKSQVIDYHEQGEDGLFVDVVSRGFTQQLERDQETQLTVNITTPVNGVPPTQVWISGFTGADSGTLTWFWFHISITAPSRPMMTRAKTDCTPRLRYIHLPNLSLSRGLSLRPVSESIFLGGLGMGIAQVAGGRER